MLELQKKKANLASAILDGNELGVSKMTEEEIEILFGAAGAE